MCRKCRETPGLATGLAPANIWGMWNEPYLETCCRSALHRVRLAGPDGRPDGLKDGPCLHRLAEMGVVRQRPDGRFEAAPGASQYPAALARKRISSTAG